MYQLFHFALALLEETGGALFVGVYMAQIQRSSRHIPRICAICVDTALVYQTKCPNRRPPSFYATSTLINPSRRWNVQVQALVPSLAGGLLSLCGAIGRRSTEVRRTRWLWFSFHRLGNRGGSDPISYPPYTL